MALPAVSGRRELRAVGHQPLRQAALRDLLQDLHGEGLGHPLHRDPRGMGGATHPGSLAGTRDPVAAVALNKRSTVDQDADSRVPDIRGSVPARCGRRAAIASSRWETRCSCSIGSSRSRHATDGRVAVRGGDTTEGERRFPADHVISTTPLRSLVQALSNPRRRRRASGRRRTEVPRLPGGGADRWTATSCFPTTGSTSTLPA